MMEDVLIWFALIATTIGVGSVYKSKMNFHTLGVGRKILRIQKKKEE